MTSKIKTLGVAFVAVMAMNALVASAAQAGGINLGNGKTKATITGHSDPVQPAQPTVFQEHILQIPLPDGQKLQVKCPTAFFEGTVSSANGQDITEAQLTATYGPSCKLNGTATTVKMNGCKYTLTGAGLAVGKFNVDITGCTNGAAGGIQISSVTGCLITIPEQHTLAHIVMKADPASPNTVTAEATVTNITNKQGALCPQPNTHAQNASFTGNTTATAFEDQGEGPLVTEHSHQFKKHLHNGVEVPIIVI